MLQVQLEQGLKRRHQTPSLHLAVLLCVAFILGIHSAHWTILPLVEADCGDIFSRNLTLHL